MDTIAELLLARAGDDDLGLVAEDGHWTWRQVVAASGARAALLARRRAPGALPRGPLFDNVPEHVLWLGAAVVAGAVLVGGNSTHRGTTWPATSPTPSVSSW